MKCVVYMVDLGQLTVKRLQKGIPDFWERTSDFDRLRRAEWVYGPEWRAKLLAATKPASKELKSAAAQPESDEPLIPMLFDDPAELDEPKGPTAT